MVSYAFADVSAARERSKHSPKKSAALLRDTRNSIFLLADTIARLLYRCVVSHEQRDEFHKAMREGSLSDGFLATMLDYVAKGLTYNGYKTKDFWELEGAPETEGYIELIYEKQMPRAILNSIVSLAPRHSEPIEAVSCQLGRSLIR